MIHLKLMGFLMVMRIRAAPLPLLLYREYPLLPRLRLQYQVFIDTAHQVYKTGWIRVRLRVRDTRMAR